MGRVCGSRSFSIKVVPVSEELPVSVYPGTQVSSKPAQSLPCVLGTQVVQGTVILNVDMHGLNGHERMILVRKMADHLNVHSSRVSFFSGQASHPIIGQLDNPTVMVAGAGDGRFARGSRSLLTWHVGCGAIKLEDLAFSKLEADTQDGTISTLLGFPVVGWHVMSGAQKSIARRRVRRQVLGVTATTMTSRASPSRMSNVSTSVIISRTVTSAFSDNSTIQLSTSALSSVEPNRTDFRSSSISINSTLSSQVLSRTDIQSSSIVNMTSSTIGISPSRNFTLSIESSPSSINRTTLISSSSLFTPMQNSTLITRTTTANVSSSDTSSLSLSTTMARNSSSITVSPNETTALVSSSLTVSSINSTRLITSSIFTTSLSSLTLAPSMSLNSSEVMRTSSFEVFSSTPASLNFSSSLLPSASLNHTTLQPTSGTISTFQLNVTTSATMSPTLPRSRQSSPMLNVSSSFVTSTNSSVLIVTSFVSQTSSSTTSLAANSSIMPSSPFSMPSSSSLVIVPSTTVAGNASLSLNLSSHLTSPPVMTLTPQTNSTTALNRSSITVTLTSSGSIAPTLSSIISTLSTVVPTVSSIAINTSSFVSPSLNTSSRVLPSSSFLPSSTVVSSPSSVRVNGSTVIGNFTSSSLQPNVSSSTTVILSSFTASPVVMSLNFSR